MDVFNFLHVTQPYQPSLLPRAICYAYLQLGGGIMCEEPDEAVGLSEYVAITMKLTLRFRHLNIIPHQLERHPY